MIHGAEDMLTALVHLTQQLLNQMDWLLRGTSWTGFQIAE
jgi:hypothetical protein